MKFNKIKLVSTVFTAMFVLGAAVTAKAELPKNVRLVIGSKSTGGDTYQNSAIVAEALSEQLGINIKVDAVGASEAFKVLERDSRGTTLMIHHDQSYLGYLYGVRGYENIFEKYKIGPTVAINPGNAYLVSKDSPFENVEDVLKAVENGEKVRVAIQPGGVSEIGFTALKNAAKLRSAGSEENLVAVNTGSQSDKNQAMFDGLADVINGSIQANEQFTQLPEDDQKAMKFIWITARTDTLEQAPDAGLGDTTKEQFLQYATPNQSVTLDGSKDFTLDKEFFFMFNKDMDEELIKEIDQALADIYAKGDIQKKQKEAFFIPNYLPSAEALDHLQAKNEDYGKIIKEISSQ